MMKRKSIATLSGMVILAAASLPPGAFAANQNDLNKLIELQKELQKTTISRGLDLSNTDLRKYPFIPGKIDLQQANLSHSNLSGVDLSKMNLANADLSYADLSNASLNQVNLAHANLDHANLSGAQLVGSDFTDANLSCSNLNQANLSKSTFTRTNISGASFVNTMTADIIGYATVVDNQQISCS